MRNDVITQKRAVSSSILVTSAGIRLPEIECDYVQLENWTVNENLGDDPTENDDGEPFRREIFYGLGQQLAHELQAGQTTRLLPVSNLNEITARTRTGFERRLFYTYFR